MTTTIKSEVRKLIKISGSCYLSIPPKFLKANNLKAGDPLLVAYDNTLTVHPIRSNKKKE